MSVVDTILDEGESVIRLLMICIPIYFVGLLMWNFITSNHEVEYYYVDNGQSSNFVISGHVEWCNDIVLDVENITYDDAVKLVRKLNDELSHAKSITQ